MYHFAEISGNPLSTRISLGVCAWDRTVTALRSAYYFWAAPGLHQHAALTHSWRTLDVFTAARHLISFGEGRYGDTVCRGGTQTDDGDPNKEPFYPFSEAPVKQLDIRTLMTLRASVWSKPYRIEINHGSLRWRNRVSPFISARKDDFHRIKETDCVQRRVCGLCARCAKIPSITKKLRGDAGKLFSLI